MDCLEGECVACVAYVCVPFTGGVAFVFIVDVLPVGW